MIKLLAAVVMVVTVLALVMGAFMCNDIDDVGIGTWALAHAVGMCVLC